MKTLGLDLGKKRIGVAMSDPLGLVAEPFTTIKVLSKDKTIAEIIKIIKENNIEVILVGVPYNMDGSSGAAALSALDFIERLKIETGLVVRPWDERLSTVAAERALLEADMTRAKRRTKIDKVAAALILQGYLDSRQGS